VRHLTCPDCGEPLPAPVIEVSGGNGSPAVELECKNCLWFGVDAQLEVKKRGLLVWSGGEGDDLNETQTRALIVEYFKYPEWTRWDHIATYGASNTEPFVGIRTAAPSSPANEKLFGNVLTLSTDAVVNGIWMANRQWTPIFPGYGQTGSFAASFYFSMRMNRSNPIGVTAGEKFQGIGWGETWTIATPWNTNYASDLTVNATIQLRYNYTLTRWELFVYSQDGNPPDVYVCDYQAPFVVDQSMPELALEWIATTSPTAITLNAYLNRKLAKRITSAENARLIDFTAFGTVGPYIFCTNGSGAGSILSEASWYEGHIYQPLPLPPTS
jgi:hypothetical protein